MSIRHSLFVAVMMLLVVVAIATYTNSACAGIFQNQCWYANAINVTMTSWNYNAMGFQYPSAWALISFKNSYGNPNHLAVAGYKNSSFLGYVPYYVVKSVGGNEIILISKHTNFINGFGQHTQNWTRAVVFYNNLYDNVPNYCPVPQNCSFGFPSNYSSVLNRNDIIKTVYSGGNTPQSITVYNSSPFWLNVSITQNFQASNNLYINATSYAQRRGSGPASAFVMLANLSFPLESRSWGIRWADSTTNWNVTDAIARYRLRATDFGSGPAVTELTQPSEHANQIFGYLGGFEGWFYSTGNQIMVDGMSTNYGTCGSFGCFVYNSSTTSPASSFGLQNNPDVFEFHIDTNQPTSYMILPAFSTDYTLSNSIGNANATTNQTPCVGFQYGYAYRQPITNLTWNYSFTTYATGNSLITTLIHVNLSNVGYTVFNMTAYAPGVMGPSCDDIQVRAYRGNTDLGLVPYYILQCNRTVQNNQFAQILIGNTSSLGQPFNSVYVYFSSTSLHINATTSNSVLKNNWNFINSNSFGTNNGPTIMKLDNPFNPTSVVNMQVSSCTFSPCAVQYQGFSNSIWPFDKFLVQEGGGTILDNALYQNINPQREFVFTANQFVSKYYYMWVDNGDQANCVPGGPSFRCTHFQNTTTEFSPNPSIVGTYVPGPFDQFSVSITNNNGNAHLYKPYSSSYTIQPLQSANNICANATTPVYPNVTSTIPMTSNGINYNATTTINFSGVLLNTVAIGDTGVKIPIAYLLMFDVFVLLISAGLYKHDDELAHLPTFLIMFILWFTSIFVIQLMILAAFITVMFIVKYYVNHKHHLTGEKRGN